VLSVDEAGRRRSFTGPSGRRELSWQWISDVAGSRGAWDLLASCRHGARRAWRRYHLEPGLARIGGAFVSAPGIAGAQPSVPIVPGAGACDTQGICFAADPFPAGQCTWYALGRRPDLKGAVRGNASTWFQDVSGKAPEGTAPIVGALAVWAANVGPAGADGHVAYVAEVRAREPRLLVDDSNWRPTPQSPELQVHEHWLSAAAVEGYIYPPGSPAGG
jgi:CHAP domain